MQKKLQVALGAVERTQGAAPRDDGPPGFTVPEVDWALRNGQFEVHYQPKVELSTGEMRGAEALARWRHPDKGLVGPAAFMGAIDTGGLIDELTRMVVADAAHNCVEWRRMGIATDVSVNLSVSSLSDVTFAEGITRLVEESSLEPQHMIFEITESATTSERGAALENLSRLRMRGFGLSIDDYGTGYSSIERLARIPFAELKIDQGFVRNAATQGSSRAIVESSLELAQKLGIVAVAEGVETRKEWSLLVELGCQLAQGHYISRPTEAAEIARWARNRPSVSVRTSE